MKLKNIKKLKYNNGGALTTSTENEVSDSSAFGASALKGAGTGAAIGATVGSVIPGVGTVIGGAAGAVVGGVTGGIMGVSENRRKNKSIRQTLAKLREARIKGNVQQGLNNFAVNANNLDERFGLNSPVDYEMEDGGFIKQDNFDITKPGLFNSDVRRKLLDVNDLKRLEEAEMLRKQRLSDEQLRKETHENWGVREGYFKEKDAAGNPVLTAKGKKAGYHTDINKSKIFNKNLQSEPIKENSSSFIGFNKMANGGYFKKLSENSVEVKGKSHENGGVKIPNTNVEVEGGETIKDNFVFSKDLGFADKHKKIAKQINDVENKIKSAGSNNILLNTLKVLKGQEEALKVSQEKTKQELGIPSELDNTFKNGGDLLKKFNEESENMISKRTNKQSEKIIDDLNLKMLPYENKLKGVQLRKEQLKKYVEENEKNKQLDAGGYIQAGSSLLSGVGNYLYNRNLIKDRQRLLDTLPDENLTPMYSPKAIKADFTRGRRTLSNLKRSIDNTATNNTFATANKLKATSDLIESENDIQNQINIGNTNLFNEASKINTDIISKNNSTTLNNSLRRLRGQDDIMRDKSQNMTNLIDNANTSLNQALLARQQNINDDWTLATTNPKVLSHLAFNNPKLLRQKGFSKQQIENLKGNNSSLNTNMVNNDVIENNPNKYYDSDVMGRFKFGGKLSQLRK